MEVLEVDRAILKKGERGLDDQRLAIDGFAWWLSKETARIEVWNELCEF